MPRLADTVAALVAVAVIAGCGDDDPTWRIEHQDLPGALLSVWASSPDDVWTVGADAGDGPTLLHYDGDRWTEHATGTDGNLWWVFGFAGGPIFAGGDGGTIVRGDGAAFEPMETPGTGTVFGLWGANPSEMWAVGGQPNASTGAFAWRLDGDRWIDAAGFPAELSASDSVWKVFGLAADDVWLVGTRGLAVHWDGEEFSRDDPGGPGSLFTIHGNGERMIAVGGQGTGALFEREDGQWLDRTPAGAVQLLGVCVGEGDDGYAVGTDGAVYRRSAQGWALEPTGTGVFSPYHAVWADPAGEVWAVGGQVLAEPLIRGVMVHKE